MRRKLFDAPHLQKMRGAANRRLLEAFEPRLDLFVRVCIFLTDLLNPATPVIVANAGMEPLQYIEVAPCGSVLSPAKTVAGAFILYRPLQESEMALARRVVGSFVIPRTAVFAEPLQGLELAAERRIGTNKGGPWAPMRTRPL